MHVLIYVNMRQDTHLYIIMLDNSFTFQYSYFQLHMHQFPSRGQEMKPQMHTLRMQRVVHHIPLDQLALSPTLNQIQVKIYHCKQQIAGHLSFLQNQ